MALVVGCREPQCGSFVCVKCARRRSISAACMIFAVKGKSASFCRMRRWPSSFSKFVLGSRGQCWDKTRRALFTRRPTTGRWRPVYVSTRSTTLYLLPVTGERRKLAISSSLKSLCSGRKEKYFRCPFPERHLQKHWDLRSLSKGKKQ